MNRFFGVMIIGVLLFAGGIGVVHAQRTLVPVIQFENQSWSAPAGKVLSEEQVREGIVKAIQTHRAEKEFAWQLDSDTPGKLGASVLVRGKHTVRVSISYTSSNFSVVYLSSDNMKAQKISNGATMIHPAYNRWVGDLVTAIRDQLGRM
jgi:hypothetical protein